MPPAHRRGESRFFRPDFERWKPASPPPGPRRGRSSGSRASGISLSSTRRWRSSASPTTAERPSPASGIPTGQSLGPAAARQASYDQFEYSDPPGSERADGAIGWYDIEADRDYLVGVTMADAGDVVIQGSDVEGNYARITAAARGIAERGALMVAVGGDHSISYPLGLGMEPLGELDVVHVDAHTDFIDVLDGSRLTGAASCGGSPSSTSSVPSARSGSAAWPARRSMA